MLRKLDPMIGKHSELQFHLRATIAKTLCGVNDKLAVAMIEQLMAQRDQYYPDTHVMTWLNGVALSVSKQFTINLYSNIQ